MNLQDITPFIPYEIQSQPWMQRLVALLQKQTEEIIALKEIIQEQRDEINRLKKMPKRPKFRPGGGNPKNRSGKPGSSNGKDGTSSNHDIAPKKVKQEVIVPASNVPEGSRFKGYQDYGVQEIELLSKDIIYRLEVWQAPDGTVIRAILPGEVQGHFGHQLRALVHTLYALGMTEPALFDFLRSSDIEISEGQVHNILMSEAVGYHQASEAILTAGIEEAPYIRTDDTGAKHQHKNNYCTHIGGEYFAYYKTTPSKSRNNFLEILLQGKEGYIINEASIWHLFQLGVEDDLLNYFEEYTGKRFATKKGLNRLLNDLGIGNKKLRLQCIEAGLVGFITETILKPGQLLLSDRAGQFAIFNHAGCWVHMERPLRKLKVSSPKAEKELGQVREAIWNLYDKVKEASYTQTGKEEVHQLYDQLVAMHSISPGVNVVIASFAKYREELLKALDHPGLPLHNNDSEMDIRGVAKRRNISGSTKSEEGKMFRDGLITLKQTCARLNINFIGYLKSWFARQPVDLASIVRDRYRAAVPA
jgi:hypothetical protein